MDFESQKAMLRVSAQSLLSTSLTTMADQETSWKSLANAKRESILSSIPDKWRLKTPIPSAEEQRDVTGSYIQQFLTKREIEITETDAAGIAKETAAGHWKAVEVAEAFCHRASLAHQLVTCHFLLTKRQDISAG